MLFKTIINNSYKKLNENLLLEDIEAVKKVFMNRFPDMSDEEFDEIIKLDPTFKDGSNSVGKYGKWLLSLYMNRELKLEDLYKATTYLKYFIKYYNVINDKDINKCKSLNDLYNIVAYYMRNDDVATSKSDEVRRIKEGAEKVYEDSRWVVIVPHTKGTSNATTYVYPCFYEITFYPENIYDYEPYMIGRVRYLNDVVPEADVHTRMVAESLKEKAMSYPNDDVAGEYPSRISIFLKKYPESFFVTEIGELTVYILLSEDSGAQAYFEDGPYFYSLSAFYEN